MVPLILLLLSSSLADEATELRIQKNMVQIFGTPHRSIDHNENSTVNENIPASYRILKREVADKTDNTEGSTLAPPESCYNVVYGTTGVCTDYRYCEVEFKRPLSYTADLIDIRISQCNHNYLEVCCRPEDVNRTTCGYSNFERGHVTSTNGSYADYLEYPWMVAILRRSETGEPWSQNDYIAGGSLIHPSVILTAAHKIENITAANIISRAGEWDTRTSAETYVEQDRRVKKILIHEHFDRASVLNSIALLILEEPYVPAPNIGYVCLGRTVPPHGTRCWSMGWGQDCLNSVDTYATVMKKVDLPIVGKDNCEAAFRSYSRLGKVFQLHESLMCAGGGGKDTCRGDGGSPLVCTVGDPKDLRYAVYGMVAYGIESEHTHLPAVYVNTSHFHQWIEDAMRAEGLSTTTFKI